MFGIDHLEKPARRLHAVYQHRWAKHICSTLNLCIPSGYWILKTPNVPMAISRMYLPPIGGPYQDGTVLASSYIIVSSMLYQQYDDLGILWRHYDSMKQWIEHMKTVKKCCHADRFPLSSCSR